MDSGKYVLSTNEFHSSHSPKLDSESSLGENAGSGLYKPLNSSHV